MEKTNSGVVVRSGIKAGGITPQHNRKPLKLRVRSGIKAGGISPQHNRKPRTASKGKPRVRHG